MQPSIETLSFKSGMSILTDSAHSAVLRDGHIVISMESGVEIRFPVAENPRLALGTVKQLSRIELSPFGIHWPDLDEDLSFQGLLAGDYGQHQKKSRRTSVRFCNSTLAQRGAEHGRTKNTRR